MPVGHCGNDSFLVFEVAIDQPDADPCLAADIVHAGLVNPAIARVVVASDRGDARAKHVAAVNFKISYPTLSPQHDATQPAWVALVNRSRRMDPASVVRQIERWRRPRSKYT